VENLLNKNISEKKYEKLSNSNEKKYGYIFGDSK
jgi:hypothetical protein